MSGHKQPDNTDTLKQLSVGIVSGILHPRYGGPSTVVKVHFKGLSPYAHIKIFGVAQHDEFDDILEIFPNAHLFKKTFPDRWFRSKGMMEALYEASSHYDIIHAHMLWDYPVYAAWKAAKRAKKPLIITPHGSLSSPWRYKAFHKLVYRKLILEQILNDTAFLHVLNKFEEIACREFGIKCPIKIIPNGLPLTEYVRVRTPEQALDHWPQMRNRRVLLYLGRLWSEKGLDILSTAWAEANKLSKFAKDWIFVIAGPDYKNYKSYLIDKIKDLGIKSQVLITGPVTGELKHSLFAAAEVFVLPSRSEGFSMALLEAIAAGLPVLYTTECNFPELAESGGGWEIPLREYELIASLSEIIRIHSDTLRAIGEKGRALGLKNYTMEQISFQLLEMYNIVMVH
ncbi:MAG: glycosyltransferase [Nitrospirota bacterium]